MNCDFVETEYFYHQLESQGETAQEDDSPSYFLPTTTTQPSPSSSKPIPNPVPSHETDVGPTEEVSNTNESSSYPYVQSNIIGDSPDLSSTSSNPVVSSSNVSPVHTTNNMRQDEDIGSEGETSRDDGDQMVNPDTGQYKLPLRSTRGVPPKRYSPDWKGRQGRYPVAYTVTGQLMEMARAFEAALYEDEEIPHSVEEAMKHEHWRMAMQKEMEALIKNKTWEKHILSEGKRPVGCRWVFTIKHRADGSIERYKARLVAKGYTQTYRIDYDETFSSVTKMSTVRVILSVAACKDMPLHQ